MSFSIHNRPNNFLPLQSDPQAASAKKGERSTETQSAQHLKGAGVTGTSEADGVDGRSPLGSGSFGLSPVSPEFSERIQGMFSKSTHGYWTGISDSLRHMAPFLKFLQGLAAQQGQDESVATAVTQLELQRGTQGPQISGEQMQALILDGAGDADAQAAGVEYQQLAKYVDANREFLSPAALAVWNQYEATVKNAQAQGQTGIAIADWDMMATKMRFTVALYALAESVGKTGPNGEVDLNDPELMARHQGEAQYVDTVNGELFSDKGPQATDVAQGEAGNCYFLATLAAVAAKNPDHIRDMIRDNGDGTYDVRFYYESPPYSGVMREEWITVDDDLARFSDGSEVYAAADDTDGDGKEEIWVAIVEKAFAQFNENHPGLLAGDNGLGGMDGVGNGGFGDEAYTVITGQPGNWANTADLSDHELWTLLSSTNDGNVVTAGTYGGDDSVLIADGIAGGHLYTVLGTEVHNGQQYVILRNPWGTVEPGMNPNDPSTWGDGIFAVTLDEYRAYFVETDYGVGDLSPNHAQVSSQLSLGLIRG